MLPLTKRQREILDYLNEFISQHGYAPSLEEIGRRFGLSSLATVHKHLTNLQEKGFIKRAWNRSRSVEMIPTNTNGRSVELPLLGYVAAGLPIEAIATSETRVFPSSSLAFVAFVAVSGVWRLRASRASASPNSARPLCGCLTSSARYTFSASENCPFMISNGPSHSRS